MIAERSGKIMDFHNTIENGTQIKHLRTVITISVKDLNEDGSTVTFTKEYQVKIC